VLAVFLWHQVTLFSPNLQAQEPAVPSSDVTTEWITEAQRTAAESEYQITPHNAASRQGGEASYQAPNRDHNFRSHFTRDAVRITPRTDEGPPWELSLSLVGVGRGTDVRAVDAPTLDPRGKRIDYRRGRLTEWYVNDERGLEQGFTLSEPPEDLPRSAATLHVPGRRTRSANDGETAEPAFVVLKLGGDLVPTVTPDGQAIDFAPRVETQGTDRQTVDSTPPPGQMFHYLIRAANLCGDGTAGTDSAFVARPVRKGP